MKNVVKSMDPREAAQAFYGQDEAVFAEMIAKLAVSDPRLVTAFENTRRRYIADSASSEQHSS